VRYPLAATERVQAKITLPKEVKAPVQKGTIAGKLTFRVGEEVVGETYLLYASDIPADPGRPTLFQQVKELLRGGEGRTSLAAFWLRTGGRRMEERLQKLLSAAGICSRRMAEEYIQSGRVAVNGVTARVGDKVDPDRDRVTVDGQVLAGKTKRVWLMLHKPRGFVTTLADEKGRRTAAELVEGCGYRVWPVGRLDLNSEGLLLFTNDGSGTNRVIHPSHQMEKEYHVTVEGKLEAALPILRGPMELDGDMLSPAQVSVLRREELGGELSVVIHQGKNRQVRRMCALAGLEVKRLVRVREGPLRLDGLKPGQWRFLTDNEIRALEK